MITVIIPVKNEEKNISKALKRIKGAEIIVVDNGSTDNTVKVARKYAKVVSFKGTRGAAQNLAAKKAKGDVLLFLHSDTRLPSNWNKLIERKLENEKVIGGSFFMKFDSSHPVIVVGSWYIWLRTLLFRRFYGDQGIFVRKKVFSKMKGFRNQALMEDYEFCSRLRKRKLAVIMKPTITSARRYNQRGIVKNHLINQFMKVCYFFNVDRKTMHKIYGMIR